MAKNVISMVIKFLFHREKDAAKGMKSQTENDAYFTATKPAKGDYATIANAHIIYHLRWYGNQGKMRNDGQTRSDERSDECGDERA